MAKTLNDFTPSDASALNDGCLLYVVDPTKGNQGDIVLTLGTLKTYLGAGGVITPPPPPPPGTVSTPTFSPAAGANTGPISVVISCPTAGVSIYYTLDGSVPTITSTLYAAPITLSSNTTIKAFAVKTGMVDSAVGSANYTFSTGGGGGGGGGGTTGGSNPTGFLSLYGANVAEYPRAYITSKMPTRTGVVINVASGGDLQAALNSAQPGDWVVLEAGGTWIGNYTLPVRNGDANSGGNNVIVVTTSAFASLPEKVRVTNATSSSLLAKIKNTNTSNVDGLRTADGGTKGWRLVGLDFVVDVTVSSLTRMISIGNGGVTQNSVNAPRNVIVDRCRFDGHSTLDLRRAIDLEGDHCAVINSWFGDEIHSTSDCQAIVSWNTAGPLKIVNNRLQGSSEVVVFGGAFNTYSACSDVEMSYNTLSHPLAWRGVAPWLVKNLFEIKKVRRLLCRYNYMHDVWQAGQAGFAVLVKHEPYNDESTGQTEDVIFYMNKVDNAAGGINIATTSGGMPPGVLASLTCRRIISYHCLYINISNSGNSSGSGYVQQLQSTDCLVSHCTFVGDSANTAVLPDTGSQRNSYRDSIFGFSSFGVKGGGIAEGNASMTTYSPGGILDRCVIGGSRTAGLYPSSCFFPGANSNIGFTNLGGGDYSLSNSSPYKNQALDGTDLGADTVTLNANVALAISGDTTTVQT